jgi:hypothetical protein
LKPASGKFEATSQSEDTGLVLINAFEIGLEHGIREVNGSGVRWLYDSEKVKG